MWLQAPNIISVHGFSTRHGGVSPAPFGSLNLGGSDDKTDNIQYNRDIALHNLGLHKEDLCFLKQVHGNDVCVAQPGKQQGDALVSNRPGDVLAVSIADCYPLIFEDPVNRVIGAAHAGWRGTVSRIVSNTITSMENLGAERKNIRVAIGQGISQQNFEVGPEVIAQFAAEGFPNDCWQNNRVNLIKCNIFVLNECGIGNENIWAMNRCTFEDDFFSHRRDNGLTGRMWALISMT